MRSFKMKKLGYLLGNTSLEIIIFFIKVISIITYVPLYLLYKSINKFSKKGGSLVKIFITTFFYSITNPKKSFLKLIIPIASIAVFSGILVHMPARNEFIMDASAAEVNTTEKMPTVAKVPLIKETNIKIDDNKNKTKADVVIPNDYRGEFISKLMEDAIDLGKEYHIYPSVIMAQAIIESDWGRSGLTKNANNYFGVKAKRLANGQSAEPAVNMLTTEYYDGKTPVQIMDYFAAYETPKASLEANAKLIRNGINGAPQFYQGSWRENAKTFEASAEGLVGKYATSPEYATTLISVIRTYGLNFMD